MLRTHKMTTVKKTIMSEGERVGKLEPADTALSTQNSASTMENNQAVPAES